MKKIISVVMVMLFALSLAGLSFADQAGTQTQTHYKDCGNCCGKVDAPAAKGGDVKANQQGSGRINEISPSLFGG